MASARLLYRATAALLPAIRSTSSRRCLTTGSNGEDAPPARQPPPPPPAGLCCMSGCANCVWLDYAQEVVDHYAERYDDASEGGSNDSEAVEALMREVERGLADDQMVLAFVKMEIRTMVGMKAAVRKETNGGKGS